MLGLLGGLLGGGIARGIASRGIGGGGLLRGLMNNRRRSPQMSGGSSGGSSEGPASAPEEAQTVSQPADPPTNVGSPQQAAPPPPDPAPLSVEASKDVQKPQNAPPPPTIRPGESQKEFVQRVDASKVTQQAQAQQSVTKDLLDDGPAVAQKSAPEPGMSVPPPPVVVNQTDSPAPVATMEDQIVGTTPRTEEIQIPQQLEQRPQREIAQPEDPFPLKNRQTAEADYNTDQSNRFPAPAPMAPSFSYRRR